MVEGTGTGDLAGLAGEGGYVARQGEPEVAYELRWSLADPGPGRPGGRILIASAPR